MLPIKKMISPYNHYDYNNPKYIVLHYTGNAKDTAYNNAKYFNGGNRNASAHYFVDDTSIYQVVEDNKGAWHVGNTKTEVNNKNSIGIEMCCSGNYQISAKTEANAIELVKHLMAKYNIPIANVRTHAEVTKYSKTCPNWNANNWQRWNNFKAKLVAKPQPKPQQPTSNSTWLSGTNFQVRIKETLNIRKSASFDAPIVGQVHKYDVYTIVSVENGLGKLKSGVGYISMNTKYVEKVETKQTSTFKEYKVKVTCDSLNVRKEPTTSSKVVTVVHKGQVYTIVGETNGWLKLKSGAGYISSAYTTRV